MTLPSTPITPAGVYVHVPFCAVRCTYCDFPTVAGQDARVPAYLDALEREIASFQPAVQGPVDTIYLGGGTPSRLAPAQIARIVAAVHGRFLVAPGAEVTLEGNPESLTEASLAGFVAAGVTRVSVGVQSLDDGVLRRVGRAHDAAAAQAAVAWALATGNCTGRRPHRWSSGEDLDRWDETIARVASWGPTTCPSTSGDRQGHAPVRAVRSGRAEVADDDLQAEAYQDTVEGVQEAAFSPTRSRTSRGRRQSRHNLKYWTDAPYAAFGLGAKATRRCPARNRKDLPAICPRSEWGDPVEWTREFDPVRRLGER